MNIDRHFYRLTEESTLFHDKLQPLLIVVFKTHFCHEEFERSQDWFSRVKIVVLHIFFSVMCGRIYNMTVKDYITVILNKVDFAAEIHTGLFIFIRDRAANTDWETMKEQTNYLSYEKMKQKIVLWVMNLVRKKKQLWFMAVNKDAEEINLNILETYSYLFFTVFFSLTKSKICLMTTWKKLNRALL